MAKSDNPVRSSLGWLPDGVLGAFSKDLPRSKKALFDSRVSYMLLRAMEIFEWKDYPETFDPRVLELYLLTQGYALVYDCKAKDIYANRKPGVYVLRGSLGGQLDASYFPTIGIPVSPYLGLRDNFDKRIGEEIAVVRNDSTCCGLASLLSLYGAEEAEAFLTLRMQLVNLRSNKLLLADSDTAKDDAISYLKKIDDGELGVIGGKRFFEILQGVKTEDMSASAQHSLKDTIEAIQYLDGKFFMELGLNASFNMKREAVNDDEVGAGEDTLFPLVEQMLEWRKKGAEEINRLYGLSLSVDLKSSWKRILTERNISLKKENEELKAMIEEIKKAKAEEEATRAQAEATQTATENAEQTDETPQDGEEATQADENPDPSNEGEKEEA